MGSQKRLGRLEGVANADGVGYCRLPNAAKPGTCRRPSSTPTRTRANTCEHLVRMDPGNEAGLVDYARAQTWAWAQQGTVMPSACVTAIICAANKRVSGNACVAYPAGATNAAEFQ